MKCWKRLGSAIALAVALLGGSPANAQSLSYSVGVTDFGAPTAFNFLFFTPIVPLFGVVNYTVSIAGTLTDATGDGIAAYTVPTDTSIFSFYSGVGPGALEIFSDPLGDITSSFGSLSYSGSFDCGVAGCLDLNASLYFAATGGGDMYAFTGSVSLDNRPSNGVPEPGTLALIAFSLAGLGYSRRKR